MLVMPEVLDGVLFVRKFGAHSENKRFDYRIAQMHLSVCVNVAIFQFSVVVVFACLFFRNV